MIINKVKVLFFVGFTRLYATLIQFVIIFILSKYFDPNDVGLYFIFMSWLMISSVFFGFGTPLIVIKEVSKTHILHAVETKTFLKKYIFLIIKISLPIIAIIYLYISYFKIFENADYNRILSYSLLVGVTIAIYRIFIEYLKAKNFLFKAISLEFNIIPSFVLLSVIAMIFIEKFNIDIFMTMYLLFYLILVVYVYKQFISQYNLNTVNSPEISWHNMSIYWFISLSVVFIANLPYIVLPFFVDTVGIATFSISHKVIAVSATLQYLINSYYAPKFSNYYSSYQYHKLNQLYSESRWLSFLTFLPFFILIYIYPESILGFFGSDYIEGVILLQILVIGRIINALIGPVDLFLNMTDNSKIELFSTSVSIFLFFLIILLYPSKDNLLVITYAYAIVYTAKSLISFIYIQYLIKHNYKKEM